MGQRVLVLMIGLLTVSACTRRAQSHAPVPALPEYLVDTGSPFWTRIDRRVPPERVFALLAAERSQPNADSVARVVAHAGPRESYRRGQWWTGDFDTVRLPYALTGEAVRYYIDLVGTFRRNAGGGVPGAPPMTDVSVRYVATVTRADSVEQAPGRPREGYVVDMALTWSNTCGDLCALGFRKTRRVWVSPNGRVTVVEGDGFTRFVES